VAREEAGYSRAIKWKYRESYRDFTFTLSLTVEQPPRITFRHPVLSQTTNSVLHQLAVFDSYRAMSDSTTLLQVLCGQFTTLFFRSPAVSTVVHAWQYCRYFCVSSLSGLKLFILARALLS